MLSYYTVTPLPLTQPTPQSVWRPHQPHPQPLLPINPYPALHNSKRSTARTTTRTTTTTTTRTTSTTISSTSTPRPSEIFGSAEGDQSTETEETGVLVDVPAQPESPRTFPSFERQVERLRAHYLKMGVPSDYLTDQMIWKLMQARAGQSDDAGFHF